MGMLVTLLKKALKKASLEAHLMYFKVRQMLPFRSAISRINLCSGSSRIPGFFNIDIAAGADLRIDLARKNLPFSPNSIDVIICMSGINYFSRRRASELIKQCHTILKPGGIVRFGVQDLEMLTRLYVQKDISFFFQKLPNGKDRFEGPTLGDKFVAWFYGYVAGGYPCRYFYDSDSLSFLFKEAGFSILDRKAYRESRIDSIERIDNRPEQMFFLEAVK